MKPLYSIFYVLILLFQPSHAGRNPYSSDCGKDLFSSDKSVSDIKSLEGLAQLFHSLRIYSAGGFYTAKRDRYLPEGVPSTLKELLESYDELQVHTKPKDNLEILWGRVQELRLAEADTAERREMTDAEFQVLWKGVSKVIEGEGDELEEDLLEEKPSAQAKSGKKSFGNQSSTRNTAAGKGRTIQQGGTVVWNWKKNRNRKSDSTAKLREERKIKILLILMEDDLMTLVTLSKELNLSKRAIDYLTAELRSEGRLSRRGDTGRRGNWVIPKEEKRKLGLLSQEEETGGNSSFDDSEHLNP